MKQTKVCFIMGSTSQAHTGAAMAISPKSRKAYQFVTSSFTACIDKQRLLEYSLMPPRMWHGTPSWPRQQSPCMSHSGSSIFPRPQNC